MNLHAYRGKLQDLSTLLQYFEAKGITDSRLIRQKISAFEQANYGTVKMRPKQALKKRKEALFFNSLFKRVGEATCPKCGGKLTVITADDQGVVIGCHIPDGKRKLFSCGYSEYVADLEKWLVKRGI